MRQRLEMIDSFKMAIKGILILNFPNSIGVNIGNDYNVIINYDVLNTTLEYELRCIKLYSRIEKEPNNVSRQENTDYWIDLKAIIPSVHLSVVWYAFVVYYIVNAKVRKI